MACSGFAQKVVFYKGKDVTGLSGGGFTISATTQHPARNGCHGGLPCGGSRYALSSFSTTELNYCIA